MKITLINPPHLESLDPILDPPLGLLYIASTIRNLGHNVSVIDLSFHTEIDNWKNIINPSDIYGITVMTPSYHHATKIRDICKEINPESKIMVGGPHPTALPIETSKDFDITVVGDGEGIIIDIINHIQNNQNSYPKIFYGNNKLMNIDEIPFPARDLVPIKEYTRTVNRNKATSIITSRGCYYQCSFCQNSTRKEKVRFRSAKNVINELKDIIFNYDIRTFIFYDDTFTLRPDLYILLDEIKKLNIQFRCNGDSRRNTYETFKKLYDAGCREIDFGIESGSQNILDNINKGTKVWKNQIAISNAKKAGLYVKAFLILGSPGESWNTIDETIDFINNTRPDYWTLFNFIPLPGCQIWNNPEKYGIKIVSNNWKDYFNIQGENVGGCVCETKYMTAEDIKKAREYMIKRLPRQTGPLQNYYSKVT